MLKETPTLYLDHNIILWNYFLPEEGSLFIPLDLDHQIYVEDNQIQDPETYALSPNYLIHFHPQNYNTPKPDNDQVVNMLLNLETDLNNLDTVDGVIQFETEEYQIKAYMFKSLGKIQHRFLRAVLHSRTYLLRRLSYLHDNNVELKKLGEYDKVVPIKIEMQSVCLPIAQQ